MVSEPINWSTSDIPDISKSIDAVVDIIEKLKPDIIEKSWSKSGLMGSGIDDVSAPDEFSTMFETQLNLNDDRSIEEDVMLCYVHLFAPAKALAGDWLETVRWFTEI